MSSLILGRWGHLVVRRAETRARLEGRPSGRLVEASRRTSTGVLAYVDGYSWSPAGDADEVALLRARGVELVNVIVEAES